ncbi:MAG: TetR/AcrR family transcriptional regulator [Bacteroidetes bacterium]|nr:TetR/AcrR family transcriptional regulator [Bacteroidota bacterium]
MSKAEKTRQFIIEKSAPIFNMKGYAGTSLADLVEATGLTKGAIYGNFENKDEVATAVYKYHVYVLNKRIANFLRERESMTEKLKGLADYYRVNWKSVFEHGGCPIQNASVEADDNAAFLKRHVQHSISGWTKGIAGLIEEGQKKGEFRKNISPEEYAYTIIMLLEGGMMLGKIMNNHKLLYSALDRIDAIIETEMKK